MINMALTDQLSKMYGPLPLGAWVALVGGGVAFMAFRASGDAGADTMINDDDGLVYDDTSTDVGVGQGGVPAGYTYTGNNGGTDTTGAGGIEDNDDWQRAAVNLLIAQGWDGTVATSAIGKYINGDEAMTLTENAYVKIALAGLGAPPSVPATYNPPKVTKPTTTPTKPVTVKPANKIKYHTVVGIYTSLKDVAAWEHTTWQALYNANKKGTKRADGSAGFLVEADQKRNLRPGIRLVVPNS